LGRDEQSRTGPADGAEILPASVPQSSSDSDTYRRFLQRRLAHQTALA